MKRIFSKWFLTIGEWVTRNMRATEQQPPSSPLPREESAGVPALEKTKILETPTKEIPSRSPQNGEAAFEKALESVANRMERVKMPREFVRNLLQPGSEIKLQAAAMQWAGMPNKNERAAMQEVLQALTAAGFLKPTSDETWMVIHVPN